MNTLDFLATIPLLRPLPPAELRRFVDVTQERRYDRGSIIVSTGDPGDSLFIVRTGQVKVVLVARDGREVILRVLRQGDHFGELALIDGRPRSAHVIALENATLLVLRREDFRREVESSPAIVWALLTEFSRRLRDADGKIGGLVLLDVPGRIARLLVELVVEGRSTTIERQLTHQMIAQMIGASRETVSRALREFEEAGWIGVERRRITVRDRGALEARARLSVA